MQRTPRLLALALLLAVPRAASPQGGTPLGPEFRVNSSTTGLQRLPAVAVDPLGNFVVAWQGVRADDTTGGVFAQRFADSGIPLGPEFRVNTYTTDSQFEPSLATDGAGNFVIVWGSYPGASEVLGQRFASDGTPLGPEFRVNTYTTGNQLTPDIAAGVAGNFVIVWEGATTDDPNGGVFGQRFASTGAPQGPEFRVNSSTTDIQYDASVATDAAGNFVVAWISTGGYGGTPADVLAQRFASDGTPLGPEFRVNTYTTYGQTRPSVASDPAGNFVVVWDGARTDDPSGVFGQRFASSGAPVGPEFLVNTSTTDLQQSASVAADSAGNFVVAWTISGGYGGVPPDIYGQRYAAEGTPMGPEFRVNTYTTSSQDKSAVAADPTTGSFVVVWNSYGQDGSDFGIFGQRFGGIVPVELMRFAVE